MIGILLAIRCFAMPLDSFISFHHNRHLGRGINELDTPAGKFKLLCIDGFPGKSLYHSDNICIGDWIGRRRFEKTAYCEILRKIK